MKHIRLSKLLLSFLSATLVTLNCFAQTELPGFGGFTDEEFKLKECPFDKTADAVVIFDQATSNYNDEYNLVTDRRIRFKILKEKGIERGNIHIRFYSKDRFEYIRAVHGITAFKDQDRIITSQLDPKTIYTRKLNDVYSEVVFAMPNLKVGSIIEYEYQSVMEHYGGLDDWYFQQELPVMLSSYKLYIMPNVTFNYYIKKSKFMPIDIKPDNTQGSIVFQMKDIPGLRDEAYSTSYRDYLQHVDFQLSEVVHRGGGTVKYSNNWKEMTRDLMEDKYFGGQINKKLSIDATPGWASSSDMFTKMKSIHDYVRKNFQWDNMYSLIAINPLKSVADRKKGTAGELNLLMIHLLKDADLTVYPLLVSERWHGKVDTTISLKDQFNKVVALVYLDNKMYVLDATDDITPCDMIPTDLLNTIGFIVDKKDYGFVHLVDDAKKWTQLITIVGTVEPGGKVKTDVSVDYYDYARVGKPQLYNSNRKKYLDQFDNSLTGFKIDSFQISGMENDNEQLHHSLLTHYELGKSGNYYLLNYNLFTGFEANPFLSDYRFTDIDFGTKHSCVMNANFQLADKYVVDALPKDITLKTPDQDLRISRKTTKNGNTISVSMQIDINNIMYSADDYDLVKQFFTKMIDVLNEPILLKEK
jgi:hypothetical protein